jgi:methyl-accepting chemotaxis protein
VAIAGGGRDCEIGHADRRDEVGDMARAVRILQDNARRADELARERQLEQQMKAEHQHRVGDLITGFEAKAGQVVEEVAQAAAGIRQNAKDLRMIAERTAGQAGEVASASEQTSANIESVASAAEE